ncbi:uncharacterized protein KY384_007352 [Bacidia gigantensis]|uniref:uncharacterized protein n=1 Tax=Bacidia gigantensis TaxID=2732470 RepID=UPI001D054E99|nr:uncharacterized protein KY384_007352 [Bacidia gigantensis]KAG8528434.1 hypothetical protein KY384_007352 [Bacidia gigantensis]
MKLIIAGATGFVATEVVRQSLCDPRITSVVALSRKPMAPPKDLGPEGDVSKFHNVIIDDYETYSDEAKAAFAGADACIWTVSINPNKVGRTPMSEVTRVCHTCAVAGLEAMYAAPRSSPGNTFRFTYMSGVASERDEKKTPKAPWWMREYCHMRGQAENSVLQFARTHENVDVQIPKPGAISTQSQSYLKTAGFWLMGLVIGLPQVRVEDCAAAILEEVVGGYGKDTLENEDLVRIGGLREKGKEGKEGREGKGQKEKDGKA